MGTIWEIANQQSSKLPEKKLRLRSRIVRKRYGTVNGVAFHGKIEFEEGTEKTPVGKP